MARHYRLAAPLSLWRPLLMMAVGLAVTGLAVGYVLAAGSVVLGVAWVLVMALAGAVLAVGRSRVAQRRFVIPVFVGMAVASLVFGLYFLVLVMGVRQPFAPRWLVPVCGLMTGAVAYSNGKALAAYYHGLLHHHQLYDYLLGNGATHREAVAWFVRRAMQRAMMPFVARMTALMVPLAATMMWALVMAGVPVLTAVLFEALMAIAMLAASLSSLWLTLVLAKRYSFDEYDRFRTKETVTETVAETAPEQEEEAEV